MSDPRLDADELIALVRRVFVPRPSDRGLGILIDLPDSRRPDHADWTARRAMAAEWAGMLGARRDELGLDVSLYAYRHVGTNNADLPARLTRVTPQALAPDADRLEAAAGEPTADALARHAMWLAPTELSATAPLKLLARAHGFRAATMPGFAASMIPALRLDYGEVRRRVGVLKGLLDPAERAEITFEIDRRERLALTLDLRHRTAHASDGVIDTPGTAGNLPSGEAYIVPYEGERDGDPSRSSGVLPVQFGPDVVRFHVEGNRAVRVEGEGAAANEHAAWLAREPAYGNLAELGLGVLADMGVEPVGEILLDEKLGLHVAFGRSDHFGGVVGAGAFSQPDAVVHIDRVYLSVLQPRIVARSVDLHLEDGSAVALMRDGSYGALFGV